MEAPHHLHGNGQLGVVLLKLHRTGTEQLQLCAAAHTGLVDVGKQRIHFGTAGQLFLQYAHVLLGQHLLPTQVVQVHGLGHFLRVLVLQDLFLRRGGLQFLVQAAPVGKPAAHHDGSHDTGQQQCLGRDRPQARMATIETLELLGQATEIKFDVLHQLAPVLFRATWALLAASDGAWRLTTTFRRNSCARLISPSLPRVRISFSRISSS